MRRFFRSRPGVFALAGLVLLVALFGLWLARVDIAERIVDDALDDSGVRATYHIEDIGFRTQKLRHLVIGDPDRPDLTADEIDVRFDLLGSGTSIVGITARGVRLYGRLFDGQLRFGELDKLRDLDSDEPFALPHFFADLEDVRLRLDTPAGPVALALSGRGPLHNGFRGDLALIGRDLALSGCSFGGMRYVGEVTTKASRPALDGKLRGDAIACPARDVALAKLAGTVDIQFFEALDGAEGGFDLAADSVRAGDFTAAQLLLSGEGSGRSGGAHRTAELQLALEPVVENGRLSGAMVADAARRFDALDGTPLAPIGDRLARAVMRAGSDFGGDAALKLMLRDGRMAVALDDIDLCSESGARFILSRGFTLAERSGGWTLAEGGALDLSGGGLPDLSLSLSGGGEEGFSGSLEMAELVAGDAMLAVPDMRFSARDGGRTRLSGSVRLSGPLAGGQLDNLRLPIVATIQSDGRFKAQPDCFEAAIDGWRGGDFALGAGSVRLCPSGTDWMVASEADGLRVSARAGKGRLTGRYQRGPAALGWDGLRVASGSGGVTARVENVDLQLGARGNGQQVSIAAARYGADGFAARDLRYVSRLPAGTTRAELESLDGRFDARGNASGHMTGFAGKIGNIPLDVSDAGGDYRYDADGLTIDGTARVAYAAAASEHTQPVFTAFRLNPMRLRLADGRVFVDGPMISEETGREVARLDLVHGLSSGSGRAVVSVERIRFDEAQQPYQLFPSAYGVISAVDGVVSGRGLISWNEEGVKSSGEFTVEGGDLAAAFGPVEGISGTIRFTDLLGLETAPGQELTMASVNPGIEVLGGRLRYQLLSGMRVRVESGEWPFAGGKLVMRPAIIDLSAQKPRYLSFYIDGLDAAQFVADMGYDNIQATGIFDGELPMVFDEEGGRIDEGRLLSRPGGGMLAYLGQLGYEDMGTFANFAFDALKSIRYDRLEIVMNGEIAGEIITEIQFSGLQQGEGAARNYITRQLAKLPIEFNLTITAPFLELVGTIGGLSDPSRMVGRNLNRLLEEQRRVDAAKEGGDGGGDSDQKPVQPTESAPVP